MKYAAIFCGSMMLLGLSACSTMGSKTENGSMGQNTAMSTAPADEQASKPGNAGNGLAYGMSQSEAMSVFNNLDANHDGVVSREEFMVNGDSGQRFPGCDNNGDGKLTQAEFMACAMQAPTTGQ